MGIRWGNTYLDYKGIKMGYITKNVIWGNRMAYNRDK